MYGRDFDGGMSGVKSWLEYPTFWLKRQVSAMATILDRVD